MRDMPTEWQGHSVQALKWRAVCESSAQVTQRDREVLDPALAYNTVLTVLGRLQDKGELTRQPVGRAYAYRAVTDRATVTAWRMPTAVGFPAPARP